LDGVAAREPGESTVNCFVDDRADPARITNSGRKDIQVRARLGDTIAGLIIWIVTLINGVLEGSSVPTVLEVSVPRVTGGIASSVNERPLVSAGIPPRCKLVDIPRDLIEEFHKVDGVGRWTFPIVEARKIGGV